MAYLLPILHRIHIALGLEDKFSPEKIKSSLLATYDNSTSPTTTKEENSSENSLTPQADASLTEATDKTKPLAPYLSLSLKFHRIFTPFPENPKLYSKYTEPRKNGQPLYLILVPTVELVEQLTRVARDLSKHYEGLHVYGMNSQIPENVQVEKKIFFF